MSEKCIICGREIDMGGRFKGIGIGFAHAEAETCVGVLREENAELRRQLSNNEPALLTDGGDPRRKRFTCERKDNDGAPGMTLYHLQIGPWAVYQFYRQEVEAIYVALKASLLIPTDPAEKGPSDE